MRNERSTKSTCILTLILALILIPSLIFGQLHKWSGFEIEKLEVTGEASFQDSTSFEGKTAFADTAVFASKLIANDTIQASAGIQADGAIRCNGAIEFPGEFAIDSVTFDSDSLILWHSDSSFGIPLR